MAGVQKVNTSSMKSEQLGLISTVCVMLKMTSVFQLPSCFSRFETKMSVFETLEGARSFWHNLSERDD